MNGLDKIIAQILDDAKQESLAIQEKAAGEAEATLAAAGEKVKKLEEEQAKSAAQREKSYKERLRSSAALRSARRSLRQSRRSSRKCLRRHTRSCWQSRMRRICMDGAASFPVRDGSGRRNLCFKT